MVRIDRASEVRGLRFDLDWYGLLLVDFAVLAVSAMEGARLDIADESAKVAPTETPIAGDMGGLYGDDGMRGKAEKVPVVEDDLDFFGECFLGSSFGI
jgi:hypothetical protein